MNTTIYYLLLLLLFTGALKAEPWVDPSNTFLRANIVQLADAGYIKAPITTFPLMWQDVINDLNDIDTAQLSTSQINAYAFIFHQFQLAKRNQKTIKANVALEDNRFTSFGDSFRDKNSISISNTFMTDHFAFNLSTSHTNAANDGDNLRFDGSYIATNIGNWVLSAGMQDRWWGSGWDSSLSISNNARPMPSITVSRKSATPVDIPFTDISMPWTVTTFMGWMDDKRYVDDTLLWGFRLSIKPIQNVEFSIVRLAQWAGDGRPKGLDTFVDVLLGLDNCGGNGPTIEECQAGEEPGNQLAGYDFRWTPSIANHQIGINFSLLAEDGNRKGGLDHLWGEERYLVGFDTNIEIFNNTWRVYFEGSDTYAKCRDGVNGDGSSDIGDCYYEHHIYKTGMRYNKRVIGSMYENDARNYVLGFISQTNNNLSYAAKFRWLNLNQDNSDKAPNNEYIGNTVTKIAEDVLMLSGKVQYSYKNWRYTLDSSISQSSFINDIDDETDINLALTVEYNL